MSEASVTGAPSSATTPEPEGLSSQIADVQQLERWALPLPPVPGFPKIKRPSIIVEPDELVRSLWRAICQECTWTCGPSVKSHIEQMAVWHRGEHRDGAVPAPLRDAEEAQRRAAEGLTRDIQRLLAGRGGAHADDIADGLARLGWRHP